MRFETTQGPETATPAGSVQTRSLRRAHDRHPDGASDGDEVAAGTNPLTPDVVADSDGDYVADGADN